MVKAQPANSPAHPQRRLVALEPKELLALFEAAKEHSPRAHAMVLAMVLLAVRHGMRASEVTGLRMEHVNLKEGWIRVSQVFLVGHSRRLGDDQLHVLPMAPESILRNGIAVCDSFELFPAQQKFIHAIAAVMVANCAGSGHAD